MNNIDNLLEQVNLIAKKYEEIAKATGENFNVFQTLNLQTKELSHSKILAELLNPQGSHGKGSAFLKSFLNLIEITDPAEHQKFESAMVETEKITKDGRIDIAIEGNQATIIIENKIHAGDQEKQLHRYRQSFPNAKIVYLTLDGHKPSDYSTNGNENTYDILLSYKSIINWLEQCKEKSSDFPYLRETNDIRIGFQFQGRNLESLIYGFSISAKDETEAASISNAENPLRKSIMAIGKNPSSPWWLFWGNLYDHLWREELADLVSKDSKVIRKIEQKITEMVGLLRE